MAAAAAASDGREEPNPKPTVAFVHGDWAHSSGWNQEIIELERRGYPVTQIGPPSLDTRPYPLPNGGTGTDLGVWLAPHHVGLQRRPIPDH